MPREASVLAVDSSVTFRQAFATAAMAAVEPALPSAGIRPLDAPPTTQRILRVRISWASQETLTLLSRPEKPPIPATSASLLMIAEAAPDWLETAIVPPPCALT